MKPKLPRTTRISAPRACAGFTLVELLVSISVIALLAAFCFAGGRKVLAAAGMAQCASNLRAIGVATASYIADHDGEFFPKKQNSIFHFVGKNIDGRPSALDRPLNPYLGVTSLDDPVKVACCNTTKGKTAYDTWGTSYNSNHSETDGSLSLLTSSGAQIPFSAADPATKRSIRMSMVNSPSRFIVAMEHGAADAVTMSDRYIAQLRTHWPDKNRFHMLFADGHVAAVEIERGKTTTANYTFSYHD